jgi:murein DD-endopeptidase MepM/ murein hydrolase activator NlpD
MRAADGRSWTYCHLSYLEPSVTTGALLPVGTPVGLVGTTGHSSGPHLHLQLAPPTSYPQAETWFSQFAGSAFSWIGSAPAARAPAHRAPVFTVVPEPAPRVESVVLFTKSS